MTDEKARKIVERLQLAASDPSASHSNLCTEAAAEIERLQAALLQDDIEAGIDALAQMEVEGDEGTPWEEVRAELDPGSPTEPGGGEDELIKSLLEMANIPGAARDFPKTTALFRRAAEALERLSGKGET